MKITRVKSSTNWKDRIAGWNTYRATFTCAECKKEVSEILQGTFEEVQRAYDALNPVCERCNKEYQRQYAAEQGAQEYATAYAMQYGITDPDLIDAIRADHFAYLMNDHSAAPRTA